MKHKTGVGDYEVDTIFGAAHLQHILSLNDRNTGKLWLRKLAHPTAFEAANKIIGVLGCLKEYDLVKTIKAERGVPTLYITNHFAVSSSESPSQHSDAGQTLKLHWLGR